MATRKATIKRTCVECSKVFDALRSDAETCSPACRAKLHRARRTKMMVDQSKVIRSQSRVIRAILPEIVHPESLANGEVPPDIKQLSYDQVCDELTDIINEAIRIAKKQDKNQGYWLACLKDPNRFAQLCNWKRTLMKQY